MHQNCFSAGALYKCHTKEGFPLQFDGRTFILVGTWKNVDPVSDSTQDISVGVLIFFTAFVHTKIKNTVYSVSGHSKLSTFLTNVHGCEHFFQYFPKNHFCVTETNERHTGIFHF